MQSSHIALFCALVLSAAGTVCLSFKALRTPASAQPGSLLASYGAARHFFQRTRRLYSALRGFALQLRAGRGGARIQDRRRQKQLRQICLNEFPECLDVLVLGLSAGVSFDAALKLYCSRYSGALSALLASAMSSWQMGLKTRTGALEELSQKLQLDVIRTFAHTVRDALAFGTPLARQLSLQSDALREEQKFAQAERIEKTPVKMIIPVATMVLPAMILAILGPFFSSFVTLA